jgi:hypothetical protein
MSEHTHTAHSATSHLPPMLTVMKETKFTFKKQVAKDELGQEVKRPPVVVNLPIPTFPGLLQHMEDAKVQQFILDLVEGAIVDQAKAQISPGEGEKEVSTQEELDLSKLDLTFIANMPKAERQGGGIPKEQWEAWSADYVQVITSTTDKGPDKATKAATIMANRFAAVKTEKAILKFLKDQLNYWASKTANLEDFQDVYQFLENKVNTLMNKDSAELLASL